VTATLRARRRHGEGREGSDGAAAEAAIVG
jgi:hypothetical protein